MVIETKCVFGVIKSNNCCDIFVDNLDALILHKCSQCCSYWNTELRIVMSVTVSKGYENKGLFVLLCSENTFEGNTAIFVVVSNINWSHLIKERICFYLSKFFLLK